MLHHSGATDWWNDYRYGYEDEYECKYKIDKVVWVEKPSWSKPGLEAEDLVRLLARRSLALGEIAGDLERFQAHTTTFSVRPELSLRAERGGTRSTHAFLPARPLMSSARPVPSNELSPTPPGKSGGGLAARNISL
jgi:hypothetical protein